MKTFGFSNTARTLFCFIGFSLTMTPLSLNADSTPILLAQTAVRRSPADVMAPYRGGGSSSTSTGSTSSGMGMGRGQISAPSTTGGPSPSSSSSTGGSAPPQCSTITKSVRTGTYSLNVPDNYGELNGRRFTCGGQAVFGFGGRMPAMPDCPERCVPQSITVTDNIRNLPEFQPFLPGDNAGSGPNACYLAAETSLRGITMSVTVRKLCIPDVLVVQ